MALVSMNCPNCKGPIQVDDSKDFGFCMYCGTKIQLKTSVDIDGVDNLHTMLQRMYAFKRINQLNNAIKCCKDILEKYPDNFEARFEFLKMSLKPVPVYTQEAVIDDLVCNLKKEENDLLMNKKYTEIRQPEPLAVSFLNNNITVESCMENIFDYWHLKLIEELGYICNPEQKYELESFINNYTMEYRRSYENLETLVINSVEQAKQKYKSEQHSVAQQERAFLANAYNYLCNPDKYFNFSYSLEEKESSAFSKKQYKSVLYDLLYIYIGESLYLCAGWDSKIKIIDINDNGEIIYNPTTKAKWMMTNAYLKNCLVPKIEAFTVEGEIQLRIVGSEKWKEYHGIDGYDYWKSSCNNNNDKIIKSIISETKRESCTMSSLTCKKMIHQILVENYCPYCNVKLSLLGECPSCRGQKKSKRDDKISYGHKYYEFHKR